MTDVEVEQSLFEEFAHFGVKGMKWGVHRSQEPANSAYTDKMRANDKRVHGKRGVKRINRRLNEGETRDKALHREDVRNAKQQLAVAGAVFAVHLINESGATPISSLAKFVGQKAAANRDAAKVAESIIKIGNSAAKTPFVKQRRGVYDISSL